MKIQNVHLQKLKMVNFLQTNHVWIVTSNFFKHPEATKSPVKSRRRATGKVVVLGPEG